MPITAITIPHPDFKANDFINPDEFDANNLAVKTKITEIITEVNGHVGANGGAHAIATSSNAGFMSASDKQKLDGMAIGNASIEVRTSDPTTPVVGQIWLRSDL